MTNLVILKWRPFKKGLFYLGPKKIFLTYFLKDYIKKVLKIYKSIVIENLKPVPLCPIKWRPFKVFVELHKSPLVIVNIIKGAALGL